MARYDDMDLTMVAAAGIVSVLAVIGSIIGIQALYYHFARAESERKVIAVESVDNRNLLAEQEARLNCAGWIDRERGIVAVPIERAMELVVREVKAAQREPTSTREGSRP